MSSFKAKSATLKKVGLANSRLTCFALLLLMSSQGLRIFQKLLFRAEEKARLRMGLWCFHHFMRASAKLFGIEVKVEGAIPKAGSLVVSNHRSYFDIPILASLFPCFFLSKAEVARWPFFGSGARAAGTLFVDRASPKSRGQAIDEMLARIQNDFTLVNFPEGTTSNHDLPLPFKLGFFQRVAGKHIQLVPTLIQYSNKNIDWIGEATFIDHLFRIASQPKVDARVIFSDPLDASQFTNGKTLRDACYSSICQARTDDISLRRTYATKCL